MRFSSLLFVPLATVAVHAQTYFYIETIEVAPAEPTTADAITIRLHGDLSSTGSSIVDVSHMLMGNVVHITVQATSGPGLDVLVPHTEEITIGNLPAGPYGILVDGAFILDSAPEFQHAFNVTGAGDEDCNTLEIQSVSWATFSDTAIVVHVTNSAIGFTYPGFILFNDAGDTLAMELVNYFAIGNDSWHTLSIHPGAELPSGSTDIRLELWTGFYDLLACSWELSVDLCPAEECVAVFPYIQNVGGGIAIGTFTWSLFEDGNEVATGAFSLTGDQQMDQAAVCMAPGSYQMEVTMDQEPTGGQLIYGVSGEGYQPGPSEFVSQLPPTLLSFQVLPACDAIANSIPDQGRASDFRLDVGSEGVIVRCLSGNALGAVRVYDAKGMLVFERFINTSAANLPLTGSGMHLVHVRNEVIRTFASGTY